MQLDTLVVDPAEARAKLAEYTSVIAAERTAEDDALAAGYRAAARGLPMIRLSAAITAGGLFGNTLPKIAVCRADARQCYVDWDGSDLVFYDGDRYDGWRRQNRGSLVNRVSVRVPGLDRPGWTRGSRHQGTTTVPLVPPRYRPRRPRRLSACHVLWEVEAWDRTPPRDPALIRHIRGDLWAVLAVWDLTGLEQAVLAQRA